MDSKMAPKTSILTSCRPSLGFSLAEILICLMILAEISTFTIPKVLTAQQNARDRAVTKETIAMVSGAVEMFKAKNTMNANTWFYDFYPYLNYIATTTTAVLDESPPGSTTVQCQAGVPCLRLANGAILRHDEDRIGGTGATNALYFMVDPDGKSGSSNKSIYFLIYANGKIRTWGTMDDPTVTQGNTYHPNSNYDPSWFAW